MIAGAHLCEIDAVQHTVEGGRPSVDFSFKARRAVHLR